jgi:transglutaminase-like putative cysteine protease
MILESFMVAALSFFSGAMGEVGVGVGDHGASDSKYNPWTDSARYELTYRVDCSSLGETVGRLRLWIPLPRTDSFQRLVRYDVDAPVGFAELTDDFGNRMLYLQPKSGDTSAKDVVVRMFVERKVARTLVSASSASGIDDPAKYLGATSKVPLGGVVGALARKVSAGISDPSQRVRAYYDHVVSNMRYSKVGTGWGTGDAVRACSAKYGNCTDFHSLLMGLSRSQGIASRFIIGFPVPSEKMEGRIAGYHCWAEVFDKTTGWIPVDASEAFKSGRRDAYFGTLPSDRVAFSVGRDLTLRPPQSDAPINFFVYPYAERDGRAIPKVPWSLTFVRVVDEE